MPNRTYVSSVRAAGAAQKRVRVIQTATRLLRQQQSIASFSLDTVARAAGVTRLTVYNQFGSRRGLLEEVFDEIARQGGLLRLAHVMDESDPRRGLDELVGIFCAFWGSDPALARLHDAMAVDPEFAQALSGRNERRRKIIHALILRLAGPGTSRRQKHDIVDLIFCFTSCMTYRMLNVGRSAKSTCALIRRTCAGLIDGYAEHRDEAHA